MRDLGSPPGGCSVQTPAAGPVGSSVPSAGSRTSGSLQPAGLPPGHWGTSRWSSGTTHTGRNVDTHTHTHIHTRETKASGQTDTQAHKQAHTQKKCVRKTSLQTSRMRTQHSQ